MARATAQPAVGRAPVTVVAGDQIGQAARRCIRACAHTSRRWCPMPAARGSRRWPRGTRGGRSLTAPWMCESGIGIDLPAVRRRLLQAPAQEAQVGIGLEAGEQRREPVRRKLDVAVELADVGELTPAGAARCPRLNARASRAKASRSGPVVGVVGAHHGQEGQSRSHRRAISSVSSREPSSTITQRSGWRSCAAIARAVRSMCPASL